MPEELKALVAHAVAAVEEDARGRRRLLWAAIALIVVAVLSLAAVVVTIRTDDAHRRARDKQAACVTRNAGRADIRYMQIEGDVATIDQIARFAQTPTAKRLAVDAAVRVRVARIAMASLPPLPC